MPVGGGRSAQARCGGRRSMDGGASVAPRPRRVPVLPSPPPRLRRPHAAPAPAPPLAPASADAWPAHRHPSSRAQMCSLAALARGCRPAAKPCCLCWCCCCSCSWAKCLAARGSEGGLGKKPREPGPQDPLLCDGDAPPTLDEIRSWGRSFDRLMRSAAGRKVFRDFLRGEYSEENIMFWLACEELKRETDPDAVEEKARFIYEDYISILSPKEVSLDSRVREVVNRNMVEPTPHTFDEAQLQIYTLMHRDSYPRFVNSPLYKALAQMSTGSPGGGPPAGPAPLAAPATPATPAPPPPP